MKSIVQVLVWVVPNASDMDCKLQAEVVIFKTWGDVFLIGYYDK